MKKILLILLISQSSFAAINEIDFNEIPNNILKVMSKEIKDSGLSINLNLNWQSETKNAGANRSDNKGIINLYGGYARIQEVTKESFALTTCHELGHLVATQYRVMPTLKYASESESDYFATNICLKKYFKSFPSNRAANEWQIEKCKNSNLEDKDLCTDLLIASKDSLGVDSVLTPTQHWTDYRVLDETKTPRTLYNDYAHVGCRYTSYIHGSLGLERPECWLNKSSAPSLGEYIPNYDFAEAMFVGITTNVNITDYGCQFEIKSISFYRESILSPLYMSEVSNKKISLFSNCNLKNDDDISGTFSQYKDEIYYNLESRDK